MNPEAPTLTPGISHFRTCVRFILSLLIFLLLLMSECLFLAFNQ